VNVAAFPTPAEADLVDKLRVRARPTISLVAEEQGDVVGHIFFSPVSLSAHPKLFLMGLAPMAVVPAWQNRGVGSTLVRAGIERCRELGAEAVAVLGHRHFYPRFGFRSAVELAIDCEYEAEEGDFMILELRPGALRGVSGTITYDPALREL
jgi:putative acetyltransferase